MFVFPALAIGATFGRIRHSNQLEEQQVAETNDFLDAELQELSNMIDFEDALAEQEVLTRSSRSLIGWNRNINHGHQIAKRMNSSFKPATSQLEFLLSNGNYSMDEIMQTMARIKARQDRIRRMKMARKMGY